MKARVVGWMALLAGSVLATPALAQQRVATATSAPSVVESTMAREVSVQLDRVTLRQAVEELGRAAGVRMFYRDAMLDAVRTPVTLRAQRMTLGMAFEHILLGTSLEAVVTEANVVTIARAQGTTGFVTGVIVGKVTHAKSRQPIAGITVLLDDAGEGVQTAADGTFRITAAAGKHTVRVRGMGFVRQAQPVTVEDDATVSVEFVLEPSASVLNEVVVTGTVVATERKAIPTPITVISAADIEQRGITRIEQLFRGAVPGVLALDVGSEAYQGTSESTTLTNLQLGAMQRSEVYVRGSSNLPTSGGRPTGVANPLKTYVDGVEILDGAYLGTIDPQTIERIEIITGPQAATLYGSGAMGGVMQIFTKRGHATTRPEVTLSVRYGTLENNLTPTYTPRHMQTLHIAGGAGPVISYSSSLSHNYTGQWQPGLFSRSMAASVGVTHVQGRMTLTGTVGTTFGINGVTTSNFGGSPLWQTRAASGDWTPFNAAGYRYGGKRTNRTSSQTISFNADYRQSEQIQHSVIIGRNQATLAQSTSEPRFGTPTDTLLHASGSSGARTTMSYNAVWTPRRGTLSSVLTLGTNGSWGERVTQAGCTVSPSATVYVNCSTNQIVRVGTTVNSDSWGGFGSWRIGLADRLFLTLGLRGERNPNYGADHAIDWTPTNGLAFTMETGDLTVKFLGSYGRATRPPLPDQRLEVIGFSTTTDPDRYISSRANPDLTPEYSRGPQGGMELYYGNAGSFTINRYTQTVTDLIQWVMVDSIPARRLSDDRETWLGTRQYLNTAKVRQHGWEATGTLNVAMFRVQGTYSWNDSRVLSVNLRGLGTFHEGQSFLNVPTHTGNLTVGYVRGNWNLTLVNNWIGKNIVMYDKKVAYLETSSSRIRTYLGRMNWPSDRWSQPGYMKSDLTAFYRVNMHLSATVNVANLGNSFGSESGTAYSPALGRQTTFGLSYRFGQR